MDSPHNRNYLDGRLEQIANGERLARRRRLQHFLLAAMAAAVAITLALAVGLWRLIVGT